METNAANVAEAFRAVLMGVSESLCELEVCARNASLAPSIGTIEGNDSAGLRAAFGRLARCLEVQQGVIRFAIQQAPALMPESIEAYRVQQWLLSEHDLLVHVDAVARAMATPFDDEPAIGLGKE